MSSHTEADPRVYHMLPLAEWRRHESEETYLPADFESVGFIHCSGSVRQMLEVANRFYAHQDGRFVILAIDPKRLRSSLIIEGPVHPDGSETVDGEGCFPHIYGGINRDAVVAVLEMKRDDEGRFTGIRELSAGADDDEEDQDNAKNRKRCC